MSFPVVAQVAEICQRQRANAAPNISRKNHALKHNLAVDVDTYYITFIYHGH